MRRINGFLRTFGIMFLIQAVLLNGCGRPASTDREGKAAPGSETAQESGREAKAREQEAGDRDTGVREEGSQKAEGGPTDGSADSAETKDRREIRAPQMTREEYPKVDGSTATLPLSMALYRLVTGADGEEAERSVVHTKTTNAYMSLLYGETDLVLAYEPAQSVYDAMKERDQELIIKPIGKDALVFMANEGNPVDSLKERDLVEIYSGRYKNWSQAGGDTKALAAFQRPVGSGSQTLMEKLVMKGVPMAEAPKDMIVGEMGELIEQVASYNNGENALGYSVYFYARNMYQKPGLKFMAVDGVMPDNETIKKGTYPYVNEFYAAVRKDEPEGSPAYRLFQWLSEEDGQALIESLGYVAMEEVSGIGKVPEDGKEPEQEKADVKLERDARILLSGLYVTGEEGVVVLNGEFGEEQTLNGMRIKRNVINIRGDEAVPMTDISTELTGLYSPGAGRWAVEPVYDSLWQDEDDTYFGYRGGRPCRVARDERSGRFVERMGEFVKVGDYWWKRSDKTFCEIFDGGSWLDEDAAPVKVMDFSGDEGYDYGYANKGLYIVSCKDGSDRIYDGAGELLFGEELPGTGYTVFDVNQDSHLIWAAEAGSERKRAGAFIYDYEKRQVLTRPEDVIDQLDRDGEEGYFTVIRDGKALIRGRDGEPVFSGDGGGFDRSFGGGWCGRQEDGIMVIENPSKGERFEIPWQEDLIGYRIRNNLFWVRDTKRDEAAFYLGKKRLMEGQNLFYHEFQGACALYGDDKSLVVNDQGEVAYEGNGEWTQEIFPEYLVIHRGNYLCITDYQGRCAFRHLRGYMGDD